MPNTVLFLEKTRRSGAKLAGELLMLTFVDVLMLGAIVRADVSFVRVLKQVRLKQGCKVEVLGSRA